MLLAVMALLAIAMSGCSSNSSNPVNTPDDEDLTPPAAPLDLSISANEGYFTISWIENSELDLAGYRIYRQINQESAYTFLADWPYARYNDLFDAQGLCTYSYRVTAVDASGNESAYSTPILTVIDNSLPQPTQQNPGTGQFDDFHSEH